MDASNYLPANAIITCVQLARCPAFSMVAVVCILYLIKSVWFVIILCSLMAVLPGIKVTGNWL